ncbi:MAG: DUF1854 domain-containing protein [Betaproteobacteria bacterium]|nr:DUF1854 domain-containing protein [Betaproteobacteria bacterium]NBY04407.1 DUF1854 domain-containing protein [Betaproteobacteria bacterium]
MNQDSLAQGEQAPLVPFELKQDAFGVWVLELTDGSVHSPVVVVRAFPVSHPLTGFSVLNRQGHELVWVDDIQTIGEAQRHALLHAVGEREFMPEIERLERVSGFIAPCTWFVQTNRGPARLLLKGEEDIRRMSSQTWLVTDAHGVQYLIRDLNRLDRHSRKLLDRFF